MDIKKMASIAFKDATLFSVFLTTEETPSHSLS